MICRWYTFCILDCWAELNYTHFDVLCYYNNSNKVQVTKQEK